MGWVWFGLGSLTQQTKGHRVGITLNLVAHKSPTDCNATDPWPFPGANSLNSTQRWHLCIPSSCPFFLKDTRISHKLAGELHGKSQPRMDGLGNSHQTALREIPASLETLTYWYSKTADWWMEARPQRNRFPACCMKDQGGKDFPECLLRSLRLKGCTRAKQGDVRHAVTLGKINLRIWCLGHQLKGHKCLTEVSCCKEN